MTHKFGLYMLLFGLVLILLFITSDVANTPDYTVFLSGVVMLVLAFVLLRRSREGPDEKPRFRMLRKLGKRFSRNDE